MEYLKESFELKNVLGGLACFGIMLAALAIPEILYNLILGGLL